MRPKNRLFLALLIAAVPVLHLKAQQPRPGLRGDTLRVASEPDYPPFCIINEAGEPDGFSVELFREAAAAMGLRAVFTSGPWHQLMQDLADGSIDALPLVGRSPEREEIFDFTFPYHTMRGAVFMRTGEAEIDSLDRLAGKEIIVMQGDNAHEYVLRAGISDRIFTTDTYETAFRQLSAGRHDVVIAQRLMGLSLLNRLHIDNIIALDIPLPDFNQDFSFAVTKGNAKLLSLLNEGLSIIIADGTYDRLHKKWWAPDSDYGMSSREKARIILPIALGMLVILSLLTFFFFRKIVRKRTRALLKEVSERRRVERALRESDTNFRLFINSSADCLFLKDTALRYVISNEANTRFIAPGQADIMGKRDEDLLPPEIAGKFRDTDLAAIKRREPVTNTIQVGENIYETRKIPVLMYNRVVGVAGIIRDITEQQNAEKALAESEERLDLALRGADLGLWDWNIPTGSVVFNERWAEMLGYSLDEIDPHVSSWEKLIHPEDSARVQEELGEHLAGKTPIYETEHRMRKKSGEWCWILDKGKVLERDAGGNPVRAVGTHMDITERKTAETKIRALLREKEILLREVHHRIKNNMGSIEGLLKIHARSSDNPEVRSALQDAESRLKSMRVLYDKLAGSDSFREISIKPYLTNLIDEIIAIFPGGQDITFSRQIEDFDIPADIYFPLGIIINELCTNSIKYAFTKGQGEKRITLTATFNRSKVKIIFQDNGKGFPESFIPGEHAGLGLELIEMLTEQIDGTIAFSTEAGAVITLEFPVSAPKT
ncbi:transporter substrate-binding domain-containing protein [bacterium]|nr:transporter substrate-binding domain-containing protein [bacterium]